MNEHHLYYTSTGSACPQINNFHIFIMIYLKVVDLTNLAASLHRLEKEKKEGGNSTVCYAVNYDHHNALYLVCVRLFPAQVRSEKQKVFCKAHKALSSPGDRPIRIFDHLVVDC